MSWYYVVILYCWYCMNAAPLIVSYESSQMTAEQNKIILAWMLHECLTKIKLLFSKLHVSERIANGIV